MPGDDINRWRSPDHSNQNLVEQFAETTSLNISFEPRSTVTMAPLPTIPKSYLDMIPQFNGEPQNLLNFIEVCDKVHTFIENVDEGLDVLKSILLGNITAKIVGKAKIEISNCDQSSWILVRKAFLDSYSDKRDIGTLTRELYGITQQSGENAFDYLHRLQQHVYLMNSYLDTHEISNVSTASAKVYNELLVLRQGLDGLKNPLQQYIKSRKPTSLNDIHNLLMNEYQKEASVKNFNMIPVPNHRPASTDKNWKQNQGKRPISGSSAQNQNFLPKFNSNPNFFSNSKFNKNPKFNQTSKFNSNFKPRNNSPRPSGSNNVPTNVPTPMSGISNNTIPRYNPQKFNLESVEEETEINEGVATDSDEDPPEEEEVNEAEFSETYTSAETHSVFHSPASTTMNPF